MNTPDEIRDLLPPGGRRAIHCATRAYTGENIIPIIMTTSENFQNKSDVPDLNQGPIGLQPIVLPLS